MGVLIYFCKKKDMKVPVNNNIRLAFDIRRGQWLVSDIEAISSIALDFLSRAPLEIETSDFSIQKVSANMADVIYSGEGEPALANNKNVAIIPIHGSLVKYKTCAGVGTTAIASEIIRLASDEDVVGIILDIDSGGGAANSVYPVIEAIKKVQQMGKPIVAHCDFCASAAYWIASQCDSVFADNPMSEFGSIGVMTQIVDARNLATGEKIITIYAAESTDKNLPYRKALDGDYGLMQDKMSPLVREFQSAVKASRKNLNAEAQGVLTGDVFRASDAINLGLADAVLTLDECVENVFVRDTYK